MTTPVRWTPWIEPLDLEREAERLLRTVLEPVERLLPVAPTPRREWVPACDLVRKGDDLILRLEVPGIDPEKDLEVTVEDGVLCVRGERRFAHEEEGAEHYRREIARGTFERAIRLPEGVEPGDVRASYENGILEVTLPKAVRSRAPKRIEVQIGAPQATGTERDASAA